SPGTLIVPAIIARDVTVFDYNGDDFPDLAFIEPSGRLAVAINFAGIFSLGPTAQVDSALRFVGTGRFDAGTTSDLLMYQSNTGELLPIFNTTLGLQPGIAITSVDARPVVRDLNNDNTVDVLWIQSIVGGGSRIEAAYGNGQGGLQAGFHLRSNENFDYT